MRDLKADRAAFDKAVKWGTDTAAMNIAMYALPEAIDRALTAEAEVERLRQKLECAETLLCLSAVQEVLENIGNEWYAEWLKNRGLEAPHA
jgi:hypothetical protein